MNTSFAQNITFATTQCKVLISLAGPTHSAAIPYVSESIMYKMCINSEIMSNSHRSLTGGMASTVCDTERGNP